MVHSISGSSNVVEYHFPSADVALEHLGRVVDYTGALEEIGFISKIFDIFMRYVNNFKTSILGILKNFKRSELKAYHESHILALNDFFKERLLDKALHIPIPSGMKVSYIRAAEELDALYKRLNIKDTISTIENYLDIIVRMNKIPPAENIINMLNKLSREETEDRLRKIFTADKAMLSCFRQIRNYTSIRHSLTRLFLL